jgi:hypothetical protein
MKKMRYENLFSLSFSYFSYLSLKYFFKPLIDKSTLEQLIVKFVKVSSSFDLFLHFHLLASAT